MPALEEVEDGEGLTKEALGTQYQLNYLDTADYFERLRTFKKQQHIHIPHTLLP